MATILGTVSELLAHVIAGHTRYATPVVAGVECADGKIRAQQGTDAGAALVSVADAALPTGAATAAKQDSSLAALLAALVPTQIRASSRHSEVAVTYVAGTLTAAIAALDEPCDGVECETSDVYVFGAQSESPRLVSIDPADWSGTGWTFAGTVATHDGSGGHVDPLVCAAGLTFGGSYYAIMYEVSGRTAGTVTDKLGTAGATARNADGVYLQALAVTINGDVSFTPSADFDGSIDITKIWVVPGHLVMNKGTIKPVSLSRILAVSKQSAPATLVASPQTDVVRAHWYRRTV